MGSHAFGFNHLSIGVCLVGGRDAEGRRADNFTDMQRAVLTKYCAGFFVEFPEAAIKGHSELRNWKKVRGASITAPSCPALDMQEVRRQAVAAAHSETRTLTTMLSGSPSKCQSP